MQYVERDCSVESKRSARLEFSRTTARTDIQVPAKWLVRDVTQEICIGLNIFILYNAIRARIVLNEICIYLICMKFVPNRDKSISLKEVVYIDINI